MENQDTGLGRGALLAFIDFAAGKGLIPQPTAQNLKVASNKVLGVLEPGEAGDVSTLDLESVFQRYRNLAATKMTPSTIHTYETRVRSAIQEFLAYRRNPSDWKPSLRQRERRQSTPSSASKPAPSNASQRRGSAQPSSSADKAQKSVDQGEHSEIVYPFPLRPGISVEIHGLPSDLKVVEARRLAAFLTTLAQDFEPTEPSPSA